MPPPAKLHIVSPDTSASDDSAIETDVIAKAPPNLQRAPEVSSPFPELPSDNDFDGVKQARLHADAMARLQLETQTLRHTEAILATDSLAAVERETREIAELNAKAEQRVQTIATARVEDARKLQLEINSRAVAEARARVIIRQRIAEEQRLHEAAQERAEAEAEANRLASQRSGMEAAAAERENERANAERNATVYAQRRLTFNTEAAAVAEANAAVEREALETTQRRHAAEERKRGMLARKIDLEQLATQQALRRAKLEAELAVEAKRRADADMLLSENVAARVAAEREAAELAQQQAAAEAALALVAAGHRDARRAEAEAMARRTEAAAQHMNAANQEQWAAGEELAGEGGNSLAGNAGTGDAPEFSITWHAEPVVRRERRYYFRWAMAGVGAIALVIALAVPQTYRHEVTGQIADRIGFGQNQRGVDLTPEETESSLQGLRMTDQLSSLPNQAR
jgi:hypothetical protein